jgi:ACS family hexuronate transporter-like MFS transporter
MWLFGWWVLYDAPADPQQVKQAELDYIRGDQPAVEEKKMKVPWLTLLRYRAVWAYVLASIFAGPAWGFYQFFLPVFSTIMPVNLLTKPPVK